MYSQLIIKLFLLTLASIYGFMLFFGEFSVVNHMDIQSKINQLEKDYASLQQDKAHLETKITGMTYKSIDLDLLEEQARTTLGYSEDNELILVNSRNY
jgi:cell division protein FtsB